MTKIDPTQVYNYYFSRKVFSKMFQDVIIMHQQALSQGSKKASENIPFNVLLIDNKKPLTGISPPDVRLDIDNRDLGFIGTGILADMVRCYPVSMFYIPTKNKFTYLFNFLPNTYNALPIIRVYKK